MASSVLCPLPSSLSFSSPLHHAHLDGLGFCLPMASKFHGYTWRRSEPASIHLRKHFCSLQGDALSVSTNVKPHEAFERRKGHEPEVQNILDSIKWDKNGLAVAIAQHANTGAILMQAFVNSDAVAATLDSGRATFYSRSRSSLWTKGETSSNFIHVKDVYIDCDRDSIIYLGLPDGPTCHTGAETCFFTPLLSLSMEHQSATDEQALTTLYSLEHTIYKRKEDKFIEKPSWTQKLLQNKSLLCSKIREEADELCRTIENNEGKARTASEMADVLYHCMVLLAVQGVKIEEIMEVLRDRFSQSGIEEKNSRSKK